MNLRDTLLPINGVTGLGSIFGLNWDGSDDRGDEDRYGKPLKGAWGDVTHTKLVLGCAIPIPILQATFKSRRKPAGCTVRVFSHITQETVDGSLILDEGPNARLRRPIDLMWLVHRRLGHLDYFTKKYGRKTSAWPAGAQVTYWILNDKGISMPVKGWRPS